ncbi:hypothetical protein, partial [Eubacterium aggregans]|uniref:hypothetical protein n=1 Tax=Eubacterium aggregans TaxID=81409 RepID=UPI003F3E3CFD
NAIFGRLRMMESLFEKGGNKVTAQEELKKLESDYLEQRYIRRLKIMRMLNAHPELPYITVGELADVIGPGITKEQLTNSAWENHLPFGWSHRGDMSRNKRTTILKDVFWDWYNSAAFVRWSDSIGLPAA